MNWGAVYKIVYRAFGVFLVAGAISPIVAAPVKMATQTVAGKSAPVVAKSAKIAKTAAKKAAVAKKAVNVPQVLTAPAMVGVQNVVSPDASKVVVPNKGKSIASAKSFTEQLKELEKGKKSDKKKVKMRKQVIDGKVCMWARTAEDAEMYASEAVRKYVGRKTAFQLKDASFVADSGRYICQLRFNYKDEMPDTWYLETEMVTGFGKTKERAFSDAMTRASSRAKTIQGTADWAKVNSSAKNATDMGVIPYDYVFATVGGESYCKVFFRYFMPR